LPSQGYDDKTKQGGCANLLQPASCHHNKAINKPEDMKGMKLQRRRLLF
jgi:hypothetical protein